MRRTPAPPKSAMTGGGKDPSRWILFSSSHWSPTSTPEMNAVGVPRMFERKTGPWRAVRVRMKPKMSGRKASVSPIRGQPFEPGGNGLVSGMEGSYHAAKRGAAQPKNSGKTDQLDKVVDHVSPH